jgi:FkbM family methyltransferase
MVLLNVVHNGLTNVELLPYALSDRREVVAYRRLGSNGAIAPLLGAESAAIGDLVQALPMDEALANEPRVDVVKIDVEGAEGRVLRGAAKIIDRFRPTLLFELTPGALAEVSDTTGASLLQWLEGYGYSFSLLTGLTRDLRAGPLGTDEVLERFEELDALHVDVMASRA